MYEKYQKWVQTGFNLRVFILIKPHFILGIIYAQK